MARAEASPPPEARQEINQNTSMDKTASTGLSKQFSDMFAESLSNTDVTSAMVRGDFVQAAVAASQDPEIQAMMNGIVLDLYGQFQNAGNIAEKADDMKRLNEHSKLGPDWRDRPKYAQDKGRAQDGAPDSLPPESTNPPNEVNPVNQSKEVTPSSPPPAALPPDYASSFGRSHERLSAADPTQDGKLSKEDLEALAANPDIANVDAAFAASLAGVYALAAGKDGDAASLSEADVKAITSDYSHSQAFNRLMNMQMREYAKRENLGLPRDASEADVRQAAEERGLNETIDEVMKLWEKENDDMGVEMRSVINRALENGIAPEIIVDALNERFEDITGDKKAVDVDYDKQADTYRAALPGTRTHVHFTVGTDGKMIKEPWES